MKSVTVEILPLDQAGSPVLSSGKIFAYFLTATIRDHSPKIVFFCM